MSHCRIVSFAVLAGLAVAGCGATGPERDANGKLKWEEDQVLVRQELEMAKQDREVEDLKRQRYHDDYYRRRLNPPKPVELVE